jgi:hypothetical protein
MNYSWKNYVDILMNRPEDDDWLEFLIDLVGYPPVHAGLMFVIFGGVLWFILRMYFVTRREWLLATRIDPSRTASSVRK